MTQNSFSVAQAHLLTKEIEGTLPFKDSITLFLFPIPAKRLKLPGPPCFSCYQFFLPMAGGTSVNSQKRCWPNLSRLRTSISTLILSSAARQWPDAHTTQPRSQEKQMCLTQIHIIRWQGTLESTGSAHHLTLHLMKYQCTREMQFTNVQLDIWGLADKPNIAN